MNAHVSCQSSEGTSSAQEVCILFSSFPLYENSEYRWFSQETALILQVWRKRVLAALQTQDPTFPTEQSLHLLKRSKHYWHQDTCEDPLYLKRRIGKCLRKEWEIILSPDHQQFSTAENDYYFKVPPWRHMDTASARQRLDQDIRADPTFATLS